MHGQGETTAGSLAMSDWLREQTSLSVLRFLTCGSVDDGKSTLIGRLLYDSQLILDDQLASLKADSRNRTTGDEGIDFSLLVDGLSAEREQGITIDVAYRFFATPRRKFIVADTPGHEQYTRNMATGASHVDLGVVLVDARKGLLVQTRRHSFILSQLGVKHVVLVVNKIDLVGYEQEAFDRIAAEYRQFADQLGFSTLQAIPVSALRGDNIVTPSRNMAWYAGPTLLSYLEEIEVGRDRSGLPFRFPVQWVNRPNLDFRGFSGTVASGMIGVGDEVMVAASRQRAKVARIVTFDGELDRAPAGKAVTILLDREIDVSRGDVLCHAGEIPEYSNQFQARLIWMDQEAAHPGRSYLLRAGTQQVPATLTALRFRTNINTLEKTAARELGLNEIGTVTLATDRPIAFDAFDSNSGTGGFILIDRISNATVGAGLIDFGLRRAQNLSYQAFEVNRDIRARNKGQTPMIVWFTGLSGSGKSTIANLVEKKLHRMNRHTFLLDGDNVRHGLNKDLGFTEADRIENIRRVGEVAKLMTDAGLIVITAFISPFRAEREMVRTMLPEGEFFEVFIDTPLSVAEARDVKGLYKKARAGDLKNFTGIDSPYEAPAKPEIRIDTTKITPEEAATLIVDALLGDG
jgi:bifunctional enzyme CysN/CysC